MGVSMYPEISGGVRAFIILFCISSVALLVIGQFVWRPGYCVGAVLQLIPPIYIGFHHVGISRVAFAALLIGWLLVAGEWLTIYGGGYNSHH